jgi:hypothetical protein
MSKRKRNNFAKCKNNLKQFVNWSLYTIKQIRIRKNNLIYDCHHSTWFPLKEYYLKQCQSWHRISACKIK